MYFLVRKKSVNRSRVPGPCRAEASDRGLDSVPRQARLPVLISNHGHRYEPPTCFRGRKVGAIAHPQWYLRSRLRAGRGIISSIYAAFSPSSSGWGSSSIGPFNGSSISSRGSMYLYFLRGGAKAPDRAPHCFSISICIFLHDSPL